MKNGTSQAVLVTDLFGGDGPFDFVADAFVNQRCSECSDPVGDETQFSFDGFLCVRCGGDLSLAGL